MDYGSVVKGAWAADPTFVELCKTLWGPATTPEDVVRFAKDGPDVSSVHVPGNASCGCGKRNCKHKGIPVLDDRGIAKAVSPSYLHGMPKADRQFKRDDHGRFSSISGIVANTGIATAAGIGGAAGLNYARGDVTNLARTINSMKQTAEGRAALRRVIAMRGGKLAAIGGASVLAGALSAHHAKEAYEGLQDHVELEREHGQHVAEAVRGDDVHAFTSGHRPQDLVVRTRGARRDAVTNVFAREAHADAEPGFSYRDTAHYRQQQDNARRNAHQAWVSDEVHKADEELTGQLTQIDADKRQVFGWASIVEKDGAPVVDLQGDYIGIEELEKSAYDYVHSSRIGGAMHRRVDAEGNVISKTDAPYHAADLIESFVVTPEKISKMGLPDSTPVGWWVGFKVNDDEVWKSVKSGDWKGFSIHGRGRRKPVGEVDSFDITGAELTR